MDRGVVSSTVGLLLDPGGGRKALAVYSDGYRQRVIASALNYRDTVKSQTSMGSDSVGEQHGDAVGMLLLVPAIPDDTGNGSARKHHAM